MMGLYVRLLESHEYTRDEYFRNRETGLRARLKLLWDIFRVLNGLYMDYIHSLRECSCY